MRKILKDALFSAAFFAGLAVLLAITSLVALPKGNSAEDRVLDVRPSGIYAEPEDTIDLVIVGDSVACGSFIPLMLWRDCGIASYVCGSALQLTYETEDWVRVACERQSPRLVIVEASTLYTPIPYTKVMMAPLRRAFPVLTYHSRWKGLHARDFFGKPAYTHIERDKGYYLRAGSDGIPVEVPARLVPGDGVEKPGYFNALYMRRIAEYCAKRNIPLMLVSAPHIKDWNGDRHNGTVRLAERLGIEYLDLNTVMDEIGIDWSTDTLDRGIHVNHAGAVKVTRYFEDYLKSTGLLPDHRGEAAYAAWDAALDQAVRDGVTF